MIKHIPFEATKAKQDPIDRCVQAISDNIRRLKPVAHEWAMVSAAKRTIILGVWKAMVVQALEELSAEQAAAARAESERLVVVPRLNLAKP